MQQLGPRKEIMSLPTLLLIEPTLISVHPLIDAARALGYMPVILCHRSHYVGDAALSLSRCEVHDLDIDDAAALIGWANGSTHSSVAGVFTTADRYLIQARQLANALGVVGPDPAVQSLNDKSQVAGIIPEYSPPFVAFTYDELPVTALTELAREFGGLIFKPTRSAGARGVFEVDEFSESFVQARIVSEQARLTGNERWIAQACIQGKLASIEGHVIQGRVAVLGHSLRCKIGKAECINRFPAKNLLPEAVRQRMKDAVVALASRSAFYQGFFHSEFIVGEDHCYLIDANFGRLAGSGLGIQIGWAYGRTPVETYMHVIDQTLFYGKHLGNDYLGAAPTATLAFHYGVREATIVSGVTLPVNLEGLFHHRFRDLGNTVPPVEEGSSALIGVLIAEEKRACDAIQQIFLQTPQGSQLPYYGVAHNNV